jgi:hypothetical protein
VTGDAGLVDASVTAGASVAGRVTFEATLRNTGGREVMIANPYEGISYHLISATGTPVQVKAPPSQAKVHFARDPAAKLSYLGLTAATVDGTQISGEEFVRSRSFELSDSGMIEMSLAVTTSIDPTDRTTLDHVPAGDYQLVVTLRTVVTLDGERHTILLRTARDLPVVVS